MERVWAQVDDYFAEHLIPADAALAASLADSDAAGLPAIQVTSAQGKFLAMLASTNGSRRVLEIGTLGGYSTIWLARALPADGYALSLEISDKHAAVARANIARAGLSDRAEVWVAPALESLDRLISEHAAPFDFVFIDADKANIDRYFDRALTLSRSGTLIVVDNVVRQGEVVDAGSADENVQGVRRMVTRLAGEQRVTAVAMQTVGGKGYDGFVLALVL